MPENRSIEVGVLVMVMKAGKVLVGQRKNVTGHGKYAFPGGHLEFNESFEDCARREVKEECDIEIDNLSFLCLSSVADKGVHYILITMAADWKTGEVKNMEPDKSEDWDWYAIDDLPEPQIASLQHAVQSYRSGRPEAYDLTK